MLHNSMMSYISGYSNDIPTGKNMEMLKDFDDQQIPDRKNVESKDVYVHVFSLLYFMHASH